MSDKDIEDLFDAIERNDESAVKQLIEEKGVPLLSLNGFDQTIAHVSAKNGNLNILKYIVYKEPSSLATIDFHGQSVIFLAIEGGQLEIVKYLVETCKVDICQPHRHCFGNSAIHKAAEEGSLVILKYFLEERNGNVNILNAVQQTPVFVAAESKHLDVIKYLVEERNANLTSIDYKRCNILYTAVNCNDLELLKYILDERKVKFDINWKDESDLTLVHRAAIQNRFEILKYLVHEKHADLNIPDKWGKTPLHSAARWNYYDFCKYLIENGANMQVKDDQDNLPIDEASEKDLVDYMEKASQKRDRRSVTKFVSAIPLAFSLSKKLLTVPRISGQNYENWVNLCTRPIYSSHIQNFLIIAEMVIGRRYKHQLFHNTSTLTPVKIAQSRGNSFVENAVQSLPHFSEPSKSY